MHTGYRTGPSTFLTPDPIGSGTHGFQAQRPLGPFTTTSRVPGSVVAGLNDPISNTIPQEADNTPYDLSHLGSIQRRRIDSLSDGEDKKPNPDPTTPSPLKVSAPMDLETLPDLQQPPQAEQGLVFPSKTLPPLGLDKVRLERGPALVEDQHTQRVSGEDISSHLLPASQESAAEQPEEMQAIRIVLHGAADLDEYEPDLNTLLEGASNALKLTPDQERDTEVALSAVVSLVKVLADDEAIKLVPLGSFLLNCMHKHKLEVDCRVLNAASPMTPVELKMLKEGFDSRKSISAHDHNIFEVYFSTSEEQTNILNFKQLQTGVKVRVFQSNFSQSGSQGDAQARGPALGGSAEVCPFNSSTAALFHASWLESNVPAHDGFRSILRLVRRWRHNSQAAIPSEVLDLAVSLSSSNFEEQGTAKIMIKFFGLFSLLLNKYNSNFYQLSEYHSYLIKVSRDLNIGDGRIDLAGCDQKSPIHLQATDGERPYCFPLTNALALSVINSPAFSSQNIIYMATTEAVVEGCSHLSEEILDKLHVLGYGTSFLRQK